MNVILISGKKGSGKDTLANMLDYIAKVGINRANYSDFEKIYTRNRSNNIFNFADPLKDICSHMLCIDIHHFYDEYQKENGYVSINPIYNYNKKPLTKEQIVLANHKIYEGNIDDAKIEDLYGNSVVYITVRQALQFIGSNWINVTLKEGALTNIFISNIMNRLVGERFVFIPDYRFHREYVILERELKRFYKNNINLIVINIVRPNIKLDSHHSENQELTYNHQIENNGTKEKLFYQAIKLYNKLCN